MKLDTKYGWYYTFSHLKKQTLRVTVQIPASNSSSQQLIKEVFYDRTGRGTSLIIRLHVIIKVIYPKGRLASVYYKFDFGSNHEINRVNLVLRSLSVSYLSDGHRSVDLKFEWLFYADFPIFFKCCKKNFWSVSPNIDFDGTSSTINFSQLESRFVLGVAHPN